MPARAISLFTKLRVIDKATGMVAAVTVASEKDVVMEAAGATIQIAKTNVVKKTTSIKMTTMLVKMKTTSVKKKTTTVK